MGLSLFKGIEKVETAKRAKRRPSLRKGHYLITLDGIKLDQTRANIPYVLLEGTVAKELADNCEQHKDDEVSFYTQQGDYFPAVCKTLVSTILGVADEEITEEVMDAFFDNTSNLVGTVLEYKVVTNDSGEKTYHNAYPQRLWSTAELEEAGVKQSTEGKDNTNALLG